jgi:hypothetical protein
MKPRGLHGRDLTNDIPGLRPEVLNHAAEFVELVCRQAPAEYQHLLSEGRFQAELERDGAFNHGKLYAYAEFTVFRREFMDRFPDASPAACINAFSGLFLKNDISIHNLVEFVEGADERGQLRLNTPR